jgi:hypothetical protein
VCHLGQINQTNGCGDNPTIILIIDKGIISFFTLIRTNDGLRKYYPPIFLGINPRLAHFGQSAMAKSKIPEKGETGQYSRHNSNFLH